MNISIWSLCWLLTIRVSAAFPPLLHFYLLSHSPPLSLTIPSKPSYLQRLWPWWLTDRLADRMGLISLSKARWHNRLPGEGCHLRRNKVLTPLLTFRRCPSLSHCRLASFLLFLNSISTFPLSASPQERKTCLSLEQKSQITNIHIFLFPLPGAFQYAMDYYLTFSIIHLFSFFPHFLSAVCLRLFLSVAPSF